MILHEDILACNNGLILMKLKKALKCLTCIFLIAAWITLFRVVEEKDDHFDWLLHRNMSIYLEAEKKMESNIACQKDLLLLTIVFSSPKNFKAREVIRETWGKDLDKFSGTQLVFLIGSSEKSVQTTLDMEEELFNDVIQANFKDSYLNLTLKTGYMLKWVTSNCNILPKYILKIDDDVFLNVQQFWKKHFNPDKKQKIGSIFTGYLYTKVNPMRQPSSKWYLPNKFYSLEVLPDFISGTAYLFSGHLAVSLYSTALRTPYINLEDVFISGLCAGGINISRSHSPGFHRKKPFWFHPCPYRTLITAHDLTPEDIKIIWMRLRKENPSTCSRLIPSLITKLNHLLWLN